MAVLALSAALALPFLGGVDAFWRINCAPILTGRVDPLVNPGAVAAHAHTLVGGSNVGVNSTYTSLLNSACTTCEVGADRSAYWSPLLYYEYPNGSFIDVTHSGAVMYYLSRGPNANNTIPFPKGFSMLSGDKAARSYDNATATWGNATYPGRPVADRVSFACLQETPSAERPYMWNTTCVNGMRAQVHFQSCWNGKDLYKADNSHVAYQSSIDNGVCPPGYPFQVPHLFMEVNYAVNDVPGQSPGGRFVFSQGDPTGYGFHADFQNGWDQAVQAAAVKDCLVFGAPDGTIDECPALQASQTNGFQFNCPEQISTIGERSKGLLSKLPGCVTITDGPGAAPAASMNCPASIPQPTIYRTVDATPRPTALSNPGQAFGLPNQQYLGCYNDSAGGVRTLNAYSFVNYTAMTVEFCQQACMAKGYRYSGVEYAQECHCDNVLNPTAIGGSNQCSWNCGGTMTANIDGTQEICGGYAYISVYNNTDPNFVANGSEISAGGSNPYAPQDPYGPTYLGCASDSTGVRALSGASTVSDTNNTVENCAAFCGQGNGYQYYGLEYGSQCYCGNALNAPSALLSATSSPSNSTCNMRCTGNERQLCGGPGAMSLYNNTNHIPPAVKTPIGKYVAKGCVAEGSGGRALQGAATSGPSMTNEMCVKFCLGKQFHYAGLEFADECYCGNSIVASTGAQQVTCNIGNLMLCAGNKLEYCGGSALMNLYYSATL